MMLPTDLAALIRATPGAGPSEETAVALITVAILDDPTIHAQWVELLATPPDYIGAIDVTTKGSDDSFDPAAVPTPGTEFRITVRKVEVAGELRMLLNPWTRNWWDSLDSVEHVRIAEMTPDATFTTCRSRFQTWTADTTAPFAPVEALRDPRSFSQDFTGDEAVVADLRPWIAVSRPAATSATYRAWKALAVCRLLAALADRVSGSAADTQYYFGGPPSCKFIINDVKIDCLFDRLTHGATWVFVEGHRDADTRHLLLANEWARSYRREKPDDIGDGAIESAKGAYSAYVKAGSKETLKAIADLRKAVVDETQKISQRAQDLAGAMWKDLAVAASPFVLKILADTARIPNNIVAGWLAAVAALFLIFSFSMMVWINGRYFTRQDEARKVWSATLNTVLTPGEIDEFSEQPINRSIDDYRAARLRVGIFYGLLVGILVLFACSSLGLPQAVTQPTPKAAAVFGNTVDANASSANITYQGNVSTSGRSRVVRSMK
jgi:hypothetical protein